ncbi:MAG: hypothetical protein ACM3VT_17175, partial [Solirubrobacterales bacterium]
MSDLPSKADIAGGEFANQIANQQIMVLLDLGEFRLQDLESILFAHHGTTQRPYRAGGHYRRGPGEGAPKSVSSRTGAS